MSFYFVSKMRVIRQSWLLCSSYRSIHLSVPGCLLVSVGYNELCLVLSYKIPCIWHSEDHASWCILTMKANEVRFFPNLFDKVLYMFRTSPPSIIRSISTLYICNRYLSCEFCWHLTELVLRYSWWWTVDLSETCRLPYEINLRNSASHWLLL
jgi:hypothetical protein